MPKVIQCERTHARARVYVCLVSCLKAHTMMIIMATMMLDMVPTRTKNHRILKLGCRANDQSFFFYFLCALNGCLICCFAHIFSHQRKEKRETRDLSIDAVACAIADPILCGSAVLAHLNTLFQFSTQYIHINKCMPYM